MYFNITGKFKYYKINLKSLIKNDTSGLFLSLGTKIGVGSIIGTISAITIGGFSSIIWIIVFSIITIPLVYKESYYGKVYLNNKLNFINNKKISFLSSVILVVLYCFLFQMIQINTISKSIEYSLSFNIIIVLIILFILILFITNLSKNKVLNLLKIIVPFKCILFVIICLFCIISHIEELDFSLLFNELLSFKSIISGFIIGCKRSIFMNEILIGTTSIASSSDSNNIDISIKYQILGIYFITFILTLLITCLVLIYSTNHLLISDYNRLINDIFVYLSGSFGSVLITIIFLLFGLTTILSGYYILIRFVDCYFNNNCINLFKSIFIIICLSGLVINTSVLWNYTDTLIFIMIIINTYSIIKLQRK